MSGFRVVSVEETKELLTQGWTYVDVRSEPEFEAGHVPGALNVPVSQKTPAGMQANPDFVPVMEAAFAKDTRIVVGCGTGPRSVRAVQALAAAGFSELVEMHTGFQGSRDAFGRLTPGWSQSGYPIETGKPPGQAYDDVQKRRPGSP